MDRLLSCVLNFEVRHSALAFSFLLTQVPILQPSHLPQLSCTKDFYKISMEPYFTLTITQPIKPELLT